MDLNISPDPHSPLAQQAAEHVRAMFAARGGELDDSHQVWNEATSAAVRSLLTPLMNKWNESDAEGAAELVATWVATYLGSYGLVATQLLHTAAAQAWRERNPGREKQTPEDLAKTVAWLTNITEITFASLAEEGRTIV